MRPERWAALLLCLALPAAAAPFDDTMGRYGVKYPGLYSALTLSSEARDRVFDAGGQRTDSAAPTYGSGNSFGEQRLQLQFEWFLPLFESERWPLISDRLWTARVTAGYSRLRTDGPITTYIAQHQLSDSGDGINDLQLEFGPVLWGSRDWRTRSDTPLSVLLLAQASLPVGARDADAPNNSGSNAFSYGATLGAHWRPLPRLRLDAGLGWRGYGRNSEPAFNGQEPSQQGADLHFDATLSARLVSTIFASASLFERHGSANRYDDVRDTASPPAAPIGMETFPEPSARHDGGTRERRAGLALQGFVTPRLLLGLHWTHALSGRSGEFDQPYLMQTAGCAATTGCNPQPNGSAHVDGLGPARSYADDQWLLRLRWNYGEGDAWF